MFAEIFAFDNFAAADIKKVFAVKQTEDIGLHGVLVFAHICVFFRSSVVCDKRHSELHRRHSRREQSNILAAGNIDNAVRIFGYYFCERVVDLIDVFHIGTYIFYLRAFAAALEKAVVVAAALFDLQRVCTEKYKLFGLECNGSEHIEYR